MPNNSKESTPAVSSLASEILRDPNSSQTAKSLAASVLAQADPSKETGAEMEDLASKVLQSDKYNENTKTLAGSVLSQSDKER